MQHTPLQRIINVRPLRPKIWLCVRPAAARKAISLDSACMRRLHGTCHCNGSSMYDRSVQGSGFACGLRPHAKPSSWTPLACAACMANVTATNSEFTTIPRTGILNVGRLRASRRLSGTCDWNDSSMSDRSVQGYGFACGLREKRGESEQTVLTGPGMQEMSRFGPQVNRKLVSSPSDSGWQETQLSVHMYSRAKKESDTQLEIASQTKNESNTQHHGIETQGFVAAFVFEPICFAK